MNFFINIIFIFIFIMSTNILPINIKILKLDIPKILANKSLENQHKDNIETTLKRHIINNDEILLNPQYIEYQIDNFICNSINDCNFNIKIFDINNLFLKKFNSINFKFENLGNSTRIKIPIDKISYNLDNKNYKIEIETEIKNISKSEFFNDKFDIFYFDNEIKFENSEYNPNFINAYFPIKNSSDAINLYVKMINKKNIFVDIFHTMAQNIEKDSIDNLNKFIVPNHIWYSAGNLELKYNQNTLKNFENNILPENIKNSIIKTFETFKGTNVVNQINIFYNNKLYENIKIQKKYKIFIPTLLNNNIYFTDIDYDNTYDERIFNYINNILSVYKNSYDKNIAILPQNIILNDTKILGNTLKLYFSNNLLKYLNNNENMAKIFLLGLNYSIYNSLEFENIEIYINNEKINKLNNIKIDDFLSKPLIIN